MLMRDLGTQPAIMFSFDRTDCEIMAQDLLSALEEREQKWRAESPEWRRKLSQYEAWLARAKERERLAARAAALKKDPNDLHTETVEWQASFNPDEPLPAFSFANTRAYSMSELEEEVRELRRTFPPGRASIPSWAFQCLSRGIAVHHDGMNKRYRMIIER